MGPMSLWVVRVICPPKRRERKTRINQWVVMATNETEALGEVEDFDREFYTDRGGQVVGSQVGVDGVLAADALRRCGGSVMAYGPIPKADADKVVEVEMFVEHMVKEIVKLAVKRGVDSGLPVPVALQAAAVAALQMVYDMASILVLGKSPPNTPTAYEREADWSYEVLTKLVRTFDPEYRLPIITPRLDEKMAGKVKP